MTPETLASLHDVKNAMLQQRTLALRELRARLDGLEAEREGIRARLAAGGAAASVDNARADARYRLQRRGALERLAERIEAESRAVETSEEELSTAFAELRAIERLMKG